VEAEVAVTLSPFKEVEAEAEVSPGAVAEREESSVVTLASTLADLRATSFSFKTCIYLKKGRNQGEEEGERRGKERTRRRYLTRSSLSSASKCVIENSSLLSVLPLAGLTGAGAEKDEAVEEEEVEEEEAAEVEEDA
jgi:hypothetical protein